VPVFIALVRDGPLNSLYRMMWRLFRYLESFRREPRVWQTDGQMNGCTLR